YQTDFRLRGLTPGSAVLPPRSSIETIGTARYRLHFNGLPTISGLFQERNARGSISFPQGPVGPTNTPPPPNCTITSQQGCPVVVQYRNTYDTSFNSGINPVFHLLGTPISLNRSEEHTSELQSLAYLVCRLLLE